jgi:hypothetical protein
MRPHVSAETLARYRQGDLSPRRSARIGAHLAKCSRCSELNEDLGGVTTLLASVHPPPVPQDLTARIQSALATEAARRVTLPAGSKPAAAPAWSGAAGPAGPADGRGARHELVPGGARGRRWRPRLPDMTPKFALSAVAAAAAVVVVGFGMFEIVNSGSPQPSTSAAGGSAAKPASGSSAPTRGPALEYRRGVRLTSITPVSAGTNFTAGRLSAQVTAAMTKYGSSGITSGPMTPASHAAPQAPAGHPATFGKLAVAALQGCVNRVAAGDLVVLVEVARFQGGPATIIVTEVTQGGPRQVWVVGTGCSASRSDVLRQSALSAAG